MKIILVFILGFTSFAWGQNKVQWQLEWDKSNSEVIIHAHIEEGWHLYSQVLKNDVGPIPTSFEFESNRSVQLIDKVQQPKAIEAFDPNFGANLDYFEGHTQFRQKLKLKKDCVLVGSVYYMVCDDQSCLPPIEVPLQIELTK